MNALTPLSDIPDRFAGDPQAGLSEVLRHFDRPGIEVETFRPIDDPGVWRTAVRVPGKATYTVVYQEPRLADSAREYDSLKQTRIKEWLHDLTNVVRRSRGESIVYQSPGDSTIREALKTAAAKPAPIARPKEQPVDAFVARVLARRQRDS